MYRVTIRDVVICESTRVLELSTVVHETSGFRAEERDEFSRWIKAGWVDTFRHFYPNENGHYTWWSNRQGVRERNIGWRIDYVLASPGAMPFIKDADIYPGDMGSDHCPIGVTVDDQIFSKKT